MLFLIDMYRHSFSISYFCTTFRRIFQFVEITLDTLCIHSFAENNDFIWIASQALILSVTSLYFFKMWEKLWICYIPRTFGSVLVITKRKGEVLSSSGWRQINFEALLFHWYTIRFSRSLNWSQHRLSIEMLIWIDIVVQPNCVCLLCNILEYQCSQLWPKVGMCVDILDFLVPVG